MNNQINHKKQSILVYALVSLIFLTFIILLRYKFPTITPGVNILLFFIIFGLLILQLALIRYKVTFPFIAYTLSISIFILLIISGFHFYEDYLKFYTLQKRLGVNHIYFIDDTNKEIVSFLYNVDTKYIAGINQIIFIPKPIFSFTVTLDGEELFGGKASGEYEPEEQNIIITNNEEFRNTFYHEVGHHIYLFRYNDSDREEWKNILNLTINPNMVNELRSHNLSEEDVNAAVTIRYDHHVSEMFADYFALYILDGSAIEDEEIKNYFDVLYWRFR